jgi:hypothetical protein
MMRVQQSGTGTDYEVVTDDGTVVATFATNAAAWDYVDRRTGEDRSPAERFVSNRWRRDACIARHGS